MKFKYIAAAMLISTTAIAQEKPIKFEVTSAEANLLGEAIGFLPYNKAAPLLQKLQAQVMQQQQTEAPKQEEKKPETDNNAK